MYDVPTRFKLGNRYSNKVNKTKEDNNINADEVLQFRFLHMILDYYKVNIPT